ncbi:Pr6Pr family membrane protein [Ilumatobacter sp.]|uniref:Pr6Pr family membrane protein n=1 Tax=Ilumatobacter sp. TaxID=1967498 RepID=UPI003C6F5386
MTSILRGIRGVMAVAIAVAIVAQFIRAQDNAIFTPTNFFSYFTVLSNLAAMVLLGSLALRPGLVSRAPFIIFRGAVTVYMAITGIVYNVLLAPAGADVSTELAWVNSVVHVIGPIVVVVDWFLDRSPTRPTLGQAATWLIFPAVWLIYTLVRGPMADWYPYPFLDPDDHSAGEIAVTCAAILLAFVLVGLIVRWGTDRVENPDAQPPIAR